MLAEDRFFLLLNPILIYVISFKEKMNTYQTKLHPDFLCSKISNKIIGLKSIFIEPNLKKFPIIDFYWYK